MSRTTVIGAGTMGTALARTLLKAGHDVTVWNRTRSKCEPLRAAGAHVSQYFVSAVSKADLVIMCVTDYAAANELLAAPGHEDALRGRTLLQFSTGTSVDARQAAAKMQKAGIPYLDGAIVAYPSDIGAPHCLILYGGDKEFFLKHSAVFDVLGGRAQWCGSDAGIPSALDSCLLLFLTSGLLGYLQSAALAAAENIPFPVLLDATVAVTDVLTSSFPDLTRRIAERSFGDDQFPIDGYAAVAETIRNRGMALGLKPRLMDAFCAVFVEAQAAGRGSHGLATLFETAFGQRVASKPES